MQLKQLHYSDTHVTPHSLKKPADYPTIDTHHHYVHECEWRLEGVCLNIQLDNLSPQYTNRQERSHEIRNCHPYTRQLYDPNSLFVCGYSNHASAYQDASISYEE